MSKIDSKTNPETLLGLVRRQIELLQSLEGLEQQKIDLLHQGDSQQLEVCSALERRAIGEMRQCHERLRSELGGNSLSDLLRQVEDPQQARALRSLLGRLGRRAAELGAVNLRNFRHVRTALLYNRALLEQGFGLHAGYSADGSLDSGAALGKQQRYRF